MLWDGKLCRANDRTSREKELLDLLLLCRRNAEPWGSRWSWCQHEGLEEGANLCQGVQPSKGAEPVVPRGEEHVSLQGFPVLTLHGGHSTTGLVGPILALHGLPTATQVKSQQLWAAPRSLSKLNSTQK